MTEKKDIKPTTVDRLAEQIKKSSPSMSSETARQNAREAVERQNRQRKN